MMRRYAPWPVSALALLLIVGATVDAGAATPVQVVRKALTNTERTAVRKLEDGKIKKIDRNYARQASAQAQHYQRLAQVFGRSGGNVKALLNAAAYFGSEAKK